LLVQEVANGSAAANAGIRGARELVIIGNAQVGVGGDLIVSVDGKTVDRQDAISRALSRKRAGDSLDVTVYRSGRKVNLKVRLGEAPDDPA
jgi:putative serine protease PepD